MRARSLYFDLRCPEQEKANARLVDAISAKWAMMSGSLFPPKHLDAAPNIGYKLSRFLQGPSIVKGKEAQAPGHFGLMADRKYPSFLHFEQVWERCQEPDFAEANHIAVSFLRIGYVGSLLFRSAIVHDWLDSNPARCEFEFRLWKGICEEGGEQPPRVKLAWNEELGGKEEDIMPVLAVCRSLKLRQYEPVASEAA